MPADIEFDFGDPAAPAGAEEESLDDDRRGPGRWLRRVPQQAWIAAAVVVLVVALVIDIRRGSPLKPVATPTTPTSSLPSVVMPVPSLQEELEAAALDNDPLVNVIRSTPSPFSCPAPRSGVSPVPAQTDAIHRDFPQFSGLETATTLDASAGLCSVNFRARDRAGAILIIRVGAPPNQAMPEVLVFVPDVTGAYPLFVGADVVTASGFRVQAGILGTSVGSYTQNQVEQLANDVALTW